MGVVSLSVLVDTCLEGRFSKLSRLFSVLANKTLDMPVFIGWKPLFKTGACDTARHTCAMNCVGKCRQMVSLTIAKGGLYPCKHWSASVCGCVRATHMQRSTASFGMSLARSSRRHRHDRDLLLPCPSPRRRAATARRADARVGSGGVSERRRVAGKECFSRAGRRCGRDAPRAFGRHPALARGVRRHPVDSRWQFLGKQASGRWKRKDSECGVGERLHNSTL
jgi:hypothetical protein